MISLVNRIKELNMSAAKTRIILAIAIAPLLAACDASGTYEADANRAACNPSYAEFYAGAGNLPVRCTAQTATFW